MSCARVFVHSFIHKCFSFFVFVVVFFSLDFNSVSGMHHSMDDDRKSEPRKYISCLTTTQKSYLWRNAGLMAFYLSCICMENRITFEISFGKRRQKQNAVHRCVCTKLKWIYQLNNAIIFFSTEKRRGDDDYHIIENKWITYEAEMNCACFHMFSTQRMRHIIVWSEINSKIDPFQYTFIYFWFNTTVLCRTECGIAHRTYSHYGTTHILKRKSRKNFEFFM